MAQDRQDEFGGIVELQAALRESIAVLKELTAQARQVLGGELEELPDEKPEDR